jgi:Spy/CpxP family protein refolding chaperone
MHPMNIKRAALILTLAASALGATAAAASAQPLEHPRKAEVLARAEHQRHEIKAEVRRGEIGPAKRQVVREVRHHRMLTVSEEHRLNRQETRIHRHLNS